MDSIGDPAWAVVALALIVAVRDVMLAWIAAKVAKPSKPKVTK